MIEKLIRDCIMFGSISDCVGLQLGQDWIYGVSLAVLSA